MKRIYIASALALATLTHCDRLKDKMAGGGGEEHKTTTGIRYILHNREGKNPKAAKVGDIVSAHVYYLTEKDSLLGSSRKIGKGRPITAKLQQSPFAGSMEECFLYVGPGDSATFMVPTDSLYKGRTNEERPPFAQKGSYLKMRIKLYDVNSQADLDKKLDKDIEGYAAKLGGSFEKQDQGLRIAYKAKGTGPIAKTGDTVSVHYRGFFPDNNEEFDSSYKRGQPYRLVAGMGNVIRGWDMALLQMPEGSKATIIVPYGIAYGEMGMPGQSPQDPGIPPYSILAFEMEIVKVTKGKGLPPM